MLGTLLLDPRQPWTLSEIAKRHGTTPSTLQRELAALLECGLILKDQTDGKVLYRANTRVECFPELQALFVKGLGFCERLREALAPVSVHQAFVYGSSAWGENHLPIDVVIVSNVSPEAMGMLLRPLEIYLGRVLNVALISEANFAERKRHGDYFLRCALETAYMTVIGDDFAEAA